MAKDLPYFKFFCSEWNDGDITLEDFKTQGLFINVCSYYWSNECYLPIDKLKKRFRHNNGDIEYLLNSGLLHNENGFLSIHFLDEQQEDRKAKSKKNSEAGEASAERRRLAKLELESNQNPTPVEITLNENPTIKIREEEIREEKKKAFNSFWTKYPKKVAKDKCKGIFLKLKESDIDIILDTIDDFLLYKPFEDYNHPNPTTYLNQKRWNDELPKAKKLTKTWSLANHLKEQNK